MAESKKSRYRGWIGTAFGGAEELALHYSETNINEMTPHTVAFFIGQIEVCPETKREHCQFFVYFHNAKTLSAVKLCLQDSTVHLEPARDLAASRAYCCKPDTRHPGCKYWEFGQFPSQGARTDWHNVAAGFTDGTLTVRSMAMDNPGMYVRYNRGIEKLHELLSPTMAAQERKMVDVVCYWGPPGCGKSTHVKNLAGPGAYFRRVGKWWSFYKGETIVILDEFDKWGKDVEAEALTWFDGGSCTVRDHHYASIPLAATTFYITANSNPRYWMSAALRSRCRLVECRGHDRRDFPKDEVLDFDDVHDDRVQAAREARRPVNLDVDMSPVEPDG